jgi:hypothetical protein
MDNLNINFRNLGINNNIPLWIQNMPITRLKKDIDLILQSDQKSLFNINKVPPELNEQTRPEYEIEFLLCLERLESL